MLKKSLLAASMLAAFYLQAQDISTIRNTADVYGGGEITGSAKYTSMAGSMGALGGDMSSVNVNPAGLGVNIVSDLNLSLGINSNKNSTSLAGKTMDNTINKTMLSNASAIIAFDLSQMNSKWKFVNVGVNYSNQKIDNYLETPENQNIKFQKNLLDANNNPVVGNNSFLGQAYDRYGDATKTNFTVAANYDNKIYIGAGLNFHDVYLEQYDSAKFGLDLDNSVNNFDKQNSPFSEQSTGFSANVGIIGKISNEFRIGAAIETPTWWTMDRIYTDHYMGGSGYMTSDNYSEDRKLRTPMKASFSAAYVPSKNFAINVDYIQGLSKAKYTVYGDAETELNEFFKDNSKGTSELRVGAEYRLEGLRIRGGYAFANSPFDNLSVLSYNDNGAKAETSYNDLILGKRNTIGAGIGYDFKAFYIDASYQNIMSEYSNPSLYGEVLSTTPYYSSGYHSKGYDVVSDAYAVSKVKNTRNNFVLTLGWKF